MCVEGVWICQAMHVEVRGQTAEVGSFLPPYGSQGSNSWPNGLVVNTFTCKALADSHTLVFWDSLRLCLNLRGSARLSWVSPGHVLSPPFGTGHTGTLHHAWLFYVSFGGWIEVIMLMLQEVYPPSTFQYSTFLLRSITARQHKQTLCLKCFSSEIFLKNVCNRVDHLLIFNPEVSWLAFFPCHFLNLLQKGFERLKVLVRIYSNS